MYTDLKFGKELRFFSDLIEEQIAPVHKKIEQIAEKNQFKILKSFQKHRVSDFHFSPSTGYGYDDLGRDTLESIYADVLGAKKGLVRPQIISGTHAITIALFGILRPGDELLYITGEPYDTLQEIIGNRGNSKSSLKAFNISYAVNELHGNGGINLELLKTTINEKTKMVGIQRSKGYAIRRSLTISEIKEAIIEIKKIKKDVIVFVDNCYGEFVEELEPSDVGADLVAGSLIKNPGGGLAKTGGYLVGDSEEIELCSERMTAPGIGAEAGPSLYSLLEMYQGFFLAPHIVSQALKGAVFSSAVLEKLGLTTNPKWNENRTDLIQSVKFEDRERMIAFCQTIQAVSPVNAHVLPTPSYMPGYEDDVIMAAGTFIQGASLELTADGPMRSPFEVYVQGGLTYEHVKIAIIMAVDKLITNEPDLLTNIRL